EAVRQLLSDSDPVVRFRTAIVLAEAKDKQAIPTLIALLSELPSDKTWPAEELLIQLAGADAPSGTTEADAATRQKYRDAWAERGRQHGDAIDLAKVDRSQRTVGLTLVVEQYDSNRRSGRVLELDAAGKVRWQIDGLQYPLDAQVLPGDRVLVVEHQAGRVSERDRKGTVIWQKVAPNPLTCQRLRNGQTFIATRQSLQVVDRDGKEVFNHHWPNGDIAA